ncbi:hypothetical protein LTR56_017750 [Elasticomyces elasticus]|nr:hypothetical protein LTR56_017750 [Elasticomyces elasticus]KAK3637715.1 hypothetical protein LTR22_018116 [Elasticomyces elasticus]KAK4915388.1 hypothetical protein LTR49_016519 [Elasticomyces elasticus]KAK5752247.1 hypothetical protein LTS12_017641 [Elasticomyces elasticus]
MPPKNKYTDPALRDEVKQEVQASDKGGAPGQWSARKAQFMASEYKKRGGGYNTDKKDQDESQKHLSKWTEEEWQTKEGSGTAKQDDGTRKRYLPKKAWEKMSEEEKQQTEDKKEGGSKEGKQFVENTEKAKDSRKKANQEKDEEFENKKAKEREEAAEDDDEADAAEDEDEAEYEDDSEADVDDEDGDAGGGDAPEQREEEDDDDQTEKADERAQPGQKQKAGKQEQSNEPTKKQKANSKSGNAPKGKIGSKHMDAKEPAPRGSADRLPKEGQKITWKAMPGYVDGEVVEILTAAKKVNGKNVKASEKDPRVVMKSESSGKICVHKPEACFYD